MLSRLEMMMRALPTFRMHEEEVLGGMKREEKEGVNRQNVLGTQPQKFIYQVSKYYPHRTALLVFWPLNPAVSSDWSIPVWKGHKIGNT